MINNKNIEHGGCKVSFFVNKGEPVLKMIDFDSDRKNAETQPFLAFTVFTVYNIFTRRCYYGNKGNESKNGRRATS